MKIKNKLLSYIAINSIIIGSLLGTSIYFINRNNNSEITLNNTTNNARSISILNMEPKQLADITDYQNKYAANVGTDFKNIVSNLDTKQSEAWTLLAKFFNIPPGVDSVNYKIKNLNVSVNSTSGLVNIYFALYDNNDIFVDQVNGVWTLTNKGTTKLTSPYYEDIAQTTENIYNTLNGTNQDDKNMIMKNIIGAIGEDTTYTFTNMKHDNHNNQIIIDSIEVTNAIGETEIINSLTINGPIIIAGNDYDVIENGYTKFIPINDYLTDSTFSDANDANSFVTLLNGNMENQDIISKLIQVENKPSGSTIKIKEAIGDPEVVVIFTIDKYYDEYGVLVEGEKDFKITYSSFSIDKLKETLISSNNVVNESGLEYAYQYTNDVLKQIIEKDINDTSSSQIIVNEVMGSIATVDVVEVNNKTGMIKTNITLDKAKDESGSEVTNKLFENIYFKIPKIVTEPTNIIRNTTTIDETINEVDKIVLINDPAQWKTFVQKYVKIVGHKPTGVDFEINSFTKHPFVRNTSTVEKSAIYKLDISLVNNIMFDDLYTYNTSANGNYIVYLNVKMNTPTKVIDAIVDPGIDAQTSNANDQLMKLTADDLIKDTNYGLLKQWIIDNFDNIFEHYSEIDLSVDDDISANGFSVTKIDDTTIDITLKLTKAVTFEGIQEVEFTFRVNNLLKPITTTLIKDIVFNTTETTKYASESIDETWLKEIVTKEILNADGAQPNIYDTDTINTKYFNYIPRNTLDGINTFVTIADVTFDDSIGQISLTIQLPAFYEKGLLYSSTDPEYANKVVKYSVTINGFQTITHSFDEMSTSIDANNEQLNESVNNNQLVSAFDYKAAVKKNIIDFLDSEQIKDNYTTTQVADIKAYVDSDAFITESKWSLVITPIIRAVETPHESFVIVNNSKLANLTNVGQWASGFKFNITNATYAVTDITHTLNSHKTITLKTFEDSLASTPLLSLTDFGFSINFAPTSNYSDNTYQSYVDTIRVTILEGNYDTGLATLKIVLPAIYAKNYIEISNYEYTFSFQFKPEKPPVDFDYVKDEIDATTTTDETGKKLSDYTAGELVGHLNDSQNLDTINNWLNSNPDIFYNDEAYKEKLTFESATLTSNSDEIKIVVSIGNPVFKTEEIIIKNLNTFLKTDPRVAQDTIPTDLTFDKVDSYDYFASHNLFLIFNEGKSPNGEQIQISKAELSSKYKDNKLEVAFINFTFNGVYMEDNNISSYEANYVVKVRLTFKDNYSNLPYGHTKMEIVTRESIPNAPSRTQDSNWFWIIIATISSLTLLAIIIILIARYRRSKEYKVEEVK